MTINHDNTVIPARIIPSASQPEPHAAGPGDAPESGAPATPGGIEPGQAGRDARPDPAQARDHLSKLIASGGTYRSIAAAAGLGPMTVHDLATGRTRPQRYTAAALLAVKVPDLERGRVDAGGTRLRLRALHVMGHGSARIARAAGASQRTIRTLVTGHARTVSVSLRDSITAVYEAWWDKRPPERDPGERASATAARRRAIAGNWCAAAALDDDLLDTPGYRPAYGWKPALGTGTAHDIITRPRATRRSKSGAHARRGDGEPAWLPTAINLPLPATGHRQRQRPA